MPRAKPYIPELITVHLGLPEQDAQNVTVPFREYVYNVASSEVYPTWEDEALRANILAIMSYALNRVYTEYYPSRGYPFQITSTTARDQAYIEGRNYFENIIRLTDSLFGSYIRRAGFQEPLAASFCNGTSSICPGLSQWGSQSLAKQGADAMQILRAYYGENIELIKDAPIRDSTASYPGAPLRIGSKGQNVVVIQVSLNEVAKNYPAIPKVSPVDGIFGPKTERSVLEFQKVFSLVPDGIVGSATWYKLVQLYVAVRQLNELTSLGQLFTETAPIYGSIIAEGSAGKGVREVQILLGTVSQYDSSIPPLSVTGYFDNATTQAVQAFQRGAGLPATGVVGEATWNALYGRYQSIEAAEQSRG